MCRIYGGPSSSRHSSYQGGRRPGHKRVRASRARKCRQRYQPRTVRDAGWWGGGWRLTMHLARLLWPSSTFHCGCVSATRRHGEHDLQPVRALGQERALASAPHMHPAGRFLDSGCGYPRDGSSFQGSSRIFNSQANGDSTLVSRFPLRLQALSDGRRHPTFLLTSACTPTLESSISLTMPFRIGKFGKASQPRNPPLLPVQPWPKRACGARLFPIPRMHGPGDGPLLFQGQGM